ncbi:MAG TPA: AEC family transporter [Limnobacter sp.]|nr:AEC family transporter [Limnobacter sp.]
MQQIFLVTLPFFALILCGYLATRGKLLPLGAIPGLNAFVLYFALPAMLFRFASGMPVTELFNPHTIVVYLLCGMVMVGLAVFTSLRMGHNWNNAAFGALVTAFPNSGFMGMPILVSLVGAEGVGAVVVSISIDMIITSSLCIALSRLGQADGQSAMLAARKAMRGVLFNPLPWAVMLGALCSATAFKLYQPLDQIVSMFAQSCSPIALFTIGAMLARPPQVEHMAKPSTLQRYGDVPVIVVYKLLLHPLLVLAVGWGYVRLGFALDAQSLTVLVLVAALPSASSITVLAERFEADSRRIAQIVLVSTAVAFVTFSAAVRWMLPQ